MKLCCRTCRPVVAERLEGRKLLSGYSVNTLGRLGLNETGADPQSPLVMDASGNLFGTTADGGAYGNGTVFEIANGSSTITPLAAFSDSQGLATGPLVIDGNGNIFGATFSGGAGNFGSIFEVIQGSGIIATLASFSSSLGTGPEGGLIADAQGNLYGNTNAGGLYGNGTIFKLPHGSSTPSVLASINSATVRPQGGMAVDATGNLFGITNTTIYELPVGASAPLTVATFTGTFVGPSKGMVLDKNGNIFGATSSGGTSGKGTLFEIVKGSGTVTTLASFNGINGTGPTLPAIDASGNLYGDTTQGGGPSGLGSGVVYKLPAGSGTITVLAQLNQKDSTGGPGVIVDATGTVIGTTVWGGPVTTGRVYAVHSGSATTTTLASFAPLTGTNPSPGIVKDSQGNLWGTTRDDGAFGFGSLYEIDHQTGQIHDVASFDGISGNLPNGSVVIDKDGNVFGTTVLGGVWGSGNVFEWERSSGSLVSRVDFQGSNGSLPQTGLIQDADGNIFGTTSSGSTDGGGSVFQLASGSHVFSTVATFSSMTGLSPQGMLAIDATGNVYGTTSGGGTYGSGAAFELPAGTSTVISLAAFPDQNNSGTSGGLVVDQSGNVFGTTMRGGKYLEGTVYEIAKDSNTFSTIVSFDVLANGEEPSPELRIDAAGNLYGSLLFTLSASGALFEVPAGGASATVLVAANNTGEITSFVLDPDGAFFGIGSGGQGRGNVFVAIPGTPAVSLRRDADQMHIDWTMGSRSGKLLASDARGLYIAGDGGNDVITLDYGGGNPLPHVLHLNGKFTIQGIEGDDPFAGTTMEIGKSTVYLSYTPGSSPFSHVARNISNGYDGGDWIGFGDGFSGAITSRNSVPGLFGVGFADSADAQVAGQPPNTIEIRYTVMGDANLDGVVNSLDAIGTARHYLAAGSLTWDLGDFNFDGSVDMNDALILQKNYNRSVAATPALVEAVTMPVATGTTAVTPLAPVVTPVTSPAPLPAPGSSGSDDGTDRNKKHGKAGKDALNRKSHLKVHY